jgi:hypothetical protein
MSDENWYHRITGRRSQRHEASGVCRTIVEGEMTMNQFAMIVARC